MKGLLFTAQEALENSPAFEATVTEEAESNFPRRRNPVFKCQLRAELCLGKPGEGELLPPRKTKFQLLERGFGVLWGWGLTHVFQGCGFRPVLYGGVGTVVWC
jgi:hypothetical protein